MDNPWWWPVVFSGNLNALISKETMNLMGNSATPFRQRILRELIVNRGIVVEGMSLADQKSCGDFSDRGQDIGPAIVDKLQTGRIFGYGDQVNIVDFDTGLNDP